MSVYLNIESKWYTIPSDQSIAGYCALSGEYVTIANVESDPRHNIYADKFTGLTTRNMICKPIFAKIRGSQKVIGVVQIINIKNREIGKDDDELKVDLFVQSVQQDIEEKYTSLIMESDFLKLFVKPIEEALMAHISHSENNSHHLKFTAAATHNQVFSDDYPIEHPAEFRDPYSNHDGSSSFLKTNKSELSPHELEISDYLKHRKHNTNTPVGAYTTNNSIHKIRDGHSRPRSSGTERPKSPIITVDKSSSTVNSKSKSPVVDNVINYSNSRAYLHSGADPGLPQLPVSGSRSRPQSPKHLFHS